MLYVPEFHCNLLSVSRLTQDNNCFVNFFSHNCVFQDQTQQKVLATGEHQDGLYYLTQSAPFSSQSAVSISTQSRLAHVNNLWNSSSKLSNSKVWHLGLGHPSEGVI